MARQLRQMGEAVPLVVILDARIDQTPLHRRALGLGGYLRYRLRGIRARGEYLMRAYVHNSRAKAMENLRTALGKRNFLSWGEEYGDEVDETAEISAVLEQVYERNNAIMKKFRLPRYAGDLLLIKSEEQGRSKYYGWAELVDGVVEKVYVPGKHSQILEAPGVARVAEEIERRIAAALREAD
jgi:thioesterase domain-containing protein